MPHSAQNNGSSEFQYPGYAQWLLLKHFLFVRQHVLKMMLISLPYLSIKVTMYWSILSFNWILPTILSWHYLHFTNKGWWSSEMFNDLSELHNSPSLRGPQILPFYPTGSLASGQLWTRDGLICGINVWVSGYFWVLLFNESVSPWVRVWIRTLNAISIWSRFSCADTVASTLPLLFIKGGISLNITSQRGKWQN